MIYIEYTRSTNTKLGLTSLNILMLKANQFFKLGLLILVSSASVSLQAQSNTEDSTDLGNTDVITSYKPDVQETVKIDIQPSLEEPKVDPPTYSYKFPNIAYKPKSVYSPINPVWVKKEEPENLFDNYIEIGGGNYLTSYLDARIFNTQDKYYTYGLELKHHAANASKDPSQGLFSQNRIKAFGAREKGNDLRGDIDYQRNVVHYYGYITDTLERSLNDINQIYNDINATANWAMKKSKFSSELDASFNIFDKLGENESTIAVINENKFKAGKGDLHLDFGVTYTQLTELLDYKRLFIDIKPHYVLDVKKITLDLGVNANYFSDSNSRIYIAPFARAETYLVPKKLRAYAGVEGDLQKNTLKSLSYENLFLGNNINYSNPYAWKFFAGMNGSFKRFVEFGIKLQQELISDQYFFISDTNDVRNFTTVIDDLTRFTFSGELKFDVNNNLDIGFRGNVYSYNVDTQNDAWHMPSYDAAVIATIRLADKIYVNGGYFATSTRNAVNLRGEESTLAAINDLNVGLEYRYKKNISGFIKVNNILNQKYEIWNNYRAQGLNALAGVTFSL